MVGEEEQNWFWRIHPWRRETALVVAAMLLVVAPWLLFGWKHGSCGRTWWLLPLAQFFGGATIFGLSAFLPTRGIGCLSMVLAFATALGVYFCMGGTL